MVVAVFLLAEIRDERFFGVEGWINTLTGCVAGDCGWGGWVGEMGAVVEGGEDHGEGEAGDVGESGGGVWEGGGGGEEEEAVGGCGGAIGGEEMGY